MYSTTPPAQGFRYENTADELARLPERETRDGFSGRVTVETYGLPYRDGTPDAAIVLCRTPDDLRICARTTDPALLDAMTREELCGREARVEANGRFELL